LTSWIEGVADFSHWNAPDFALLKNGGLIGVILKATQGTSYKDPTFTSRAMLASSLGLLVGAYHFADGSDPQTQANFFCRETVGIPLLGIDIEENSTNASTVTVPQAAEIVSYVHGITAKLPLCYIGRYGPDKRATGLPNTILSRCPLWLPEYGTNPITPPGFGTPMLWQWQSVPYDRNRFNGTEAELRAFWNGAGR
jgi:lysozyme